MMATSTGFRRILYSSVPAGTDFEADRLAVIERSQRANGLDGITGALWSAPDLYIQVLEGPPDAVGETFARIVRDTRHHSITVLSDTVEAERLFGTWAMTSFWASSSPVLEQRMLGLLLQSADPRREMLAARIAR